MHTPQAESAPFALDADWLCLDFCNTADGDIRDEWRERLSTYADLVAFAGQSGLLSAEQADDLLTTASARPAEATAALDAAHVLRWTLYRVFSASAQGQPPPPDALESFNAGLAAALGHLRVAPSDGGFTWDWDDSDALERILWPVLWSAGQLLTTKHMSQVRECAGETCTWLFLDTSRNHSRRWCDMRSCGNRAKVKAHYHRMKTTS